MADKMKSLKLLIIAGTLIFLSEGANAEWTLVTENQALDLYYLDWDTLKRADGNRQIWMIQDHKNANKNGVVSNLSMTEFDCKGQRFRFKRTIAYPDHLGNGKVLGTVTSDEWIEMPPGTSIDGRARLVCSKK